LTVNSISGTGWSCSSSSVTCQRSDALAASTSYPAISLVVNVVAGSSGGITNTVNVSGGGGINNTNQFSTDPPKCTPPSPSLTQNPPRQLYCGPAGNLSHHGRLYRSRTDPRYRYCDRFHAAGAHSHSYERNRMELLGPAYHFPDMYAI